MVVCHVQNDSGIGVPAFARLDNLRLRQIIERGNTRLLDFGPTYYRRGNSQIGSMLETHWQVDEKPTSHAAQKDFRAEAREQSARRTAYPANLRLALGLSK